MMRHTWRDELAARGETANEADLYDCPTCGHSVEAFALNLDDDGEWRCYRCPRAPEPAPAMTWEDVRGGRRVFLEASDWTQLADVPQATRDLWTPLRQRARDLTELATVDAAMAELEALRSEAATV